MREPAIILSLEPTYAKASGGNKNGHQQQHSQKKLSVGKAFQVEGPRFPPKLPSLCWQKGFDGLIESWLFYLLPLATAIFK